MNKQIWLIIVCVLLGVALLPLPYGYYQFMRLIVCGVSIWILIYSHNQNIKLPVGLFFTAIAYNPIFKIHLDKGIWSIVNVITIIYFVYLISQQKDKE
jgi:hypothetical protein